MGSRSAKGVVLVVLTDLKITDMGSGPKMGSNAAKYMIFRD